MPQKQIPPNTSLQAGKQIVNENASDAGNRLAAQEAGALTEAEADALYKAIGYIPAWAEITGKPATFPPSSHKHGGADITSGTVPVARIGSGTKDATTVYHGDGTFKTVSVGPAKRLGGIKKVSPARMVAFEATTELSADFAKGKAVDGDNEINSGAASNPKGWITTSKQVSALVGERIGIRVGPMHWVAIGDSITEGVGENQTGGHSPYGPAGTHPQTNDNPFHSYQIHLQQMQERLVVNEGVGGQTTDQILARFPTSVHFYRPDYCSILAGTAHLGQDGTAAGVAAIKTNLQSMYDSCVANGTAPIAVTLPPRTGMDAQVQDINSWIRQHAKANGYLLADVYAALNSPTTPGTMRTEWDRGDGIHPNEAGLAQLATAFESVVEGMSPAPRLSVIGLSSIQGASPPGNYIKPSSISIISGRSEITRAVRRTDKLIYDLPVEKQIDPIEVPKELGPRFASFYVRFDAFPGDQTLSKFSGWGEVIAGVQR